MNISDLISERITELLDEFGGVAEIRRSALAQRMGCVPSQINYVITSRFGPEAGYIVESRRGGGGYIRITRVSGSKEETLMHLVNLVGAAIDEASARAALGNLVHLSLVEPTQARLVLAAISEGALAPLENDKRAEVRAQIFKKLLCCLANED